MSLDALKIHLAITRMTTDWRKVWGIFFIILAEEGALVLIALTIKGIGTGY